jgi:pyridoxine 5-phosphate synthase
LTRFNLPAIAAIAEIEEVNIGHAIIADSLFMGLGSAVRAMREALNRGLALREK